MTNTNSSDRQWARSLHGLPEECETSPCDDVQCATLHLHALCFVCARAIMRGRSAEAAPPRPRACGSARLLRGRARGTLTSSPAPMQRRQLRRPALRRSSSTHPRETSKEPDLCAFAHLLPDLIRCVDSGVAPQQRGRLDSGDSGVPFCSSAASTALPRYVFGEELELLIFFQGCESERRALRPHASRCRRPSICCSIPALVMPAVAVSLCCMQLKSFRSPRSRRVRGPSSAVMR